MKYRLLVIALLLLPALSMAQRSRGNFKLAFTTSPTWGWMEFPANDPAYKANGSRAQSLYGIIGDFGFSENYFFSSGLTLTSIGSKVLYTTSTGQENISYSIQYVEVPLTIKLKSNEAKFRAYGQFGLDAGIKVANRHTFNVDIKTKANLFRLGLLTGGGAEWSLTKSMHLLTGVSYNKGFTRVFSSPDTKNSYVALNLGVFF